MWRKSQRRRQNPRAAPPKSPVHSTALLVPTMFRRQSSATKSWLVLKCNFLAGFEAQSDSIDQPHFDLIQDGMTRANVETIFGMPAGQYDWAESESHARIWHAFAALRLEEAKMLERKTATQVGTLEDTMDLRRRLIAEARSFYSRAAASETWTSRLGAF